MLLLLREVRAFDKWPCDWCVHREEEESISGVAKRATPAAAESRPRRWPRAAIA